MFPKRIALLPWREIDGRAVVIQPSRGEVHELDECATFLWAQAEGDAPVDELARRMLEQFEADEAGAAQALADATSFFAELEAKGLIEFVTG